MMGKEILQIDAEMVEKIEVKVVSVCMSVSPTRFDPGSVSSSTSM